MKLHESLRKIIRQFGTNVLSEKRLLFILSDFRAFEEYPALKQVFEAIVSTGAGKELMRLSLDDDRAGCISYAQNLKKSLSEDRHFRKDLAACAVDSILFALGLTDTVTEPSDHGFDPVERNGTGLTYAGIRTEGSEAEDNGAGNGSSGRGSGAGAAGESAPGSREKNLQKAQGSTAPSGSSGAAPLKAGSKSSSNSMKWAVAAVLIAGIVFGWLLSGLMNRQDSSVAGQAASSTAIQYSAGDVKSGGNDAGGLSGQNAHEEGKAYYLDLQVIRVSPEEVRQLRRSAEQGNALAQNNLGVMYAEGQGVSRDAAEAVRWFRQSAERGNSAGESNLGEMYRNGRGVGRDDAEAVRWLRRSAEQGDAAGAANLGGMYEEGRGVSQDYGEALKWLKKAAEQGIAFGQSSLGSMYAEGRGVPRDDAEAAKWLGKAAKWYLKSAEEGNPSSQLSLGSMYAQGEGFTQDYAEAAKWFRKAADLGNSDAQSALGMMYETGNGVSRDDAEAVRWYRKSA